MRKALRSGGRVFGLLAGWVVAGGCSGTAGERAAPLTTAPATGASAVVAARPAPAPAVDETIELRAEITRLVGPAACRSDSQCRTLPLGSKPCGGPEGYLAWSSEGTDARALEAAAVRYRDGRRLRNERLGLMSDCAVVPEPAVRCVVAAGAAAGSVGQCQTQALQPNLRPGLR